MFANIASLVALICLRVIIVSSEDRRVTYDLIVDIVNREMAPTALVVPPEICWDIHEIQQLSRKLMAAGVSVTRSPRLDHPSTRHHQLLLFDLSCSSAQQFLEKANISGLFRSPYRWLLLRDGRDTRRQHDEQYVGILARLDILVDSSVLLADRQPGNAFDLVEVYKIAKGSEVIELARDRRKPRPLPSSRRDLRGHTLTVSNVVVDNPATRQHLGDRMDLKDDGITKMSWAAACACAEMLNATPRAVFTDTWGYRDSAGRWQGMIQQLLHDEADLGTLAIFTKERMEFIDYIAMIGSTSVRFVFRQPPLSYITNIYTLPFSQGVWIAISVCVLASAAVLYVATKWEASVDVHPNQLNGTWADVLILTISALLQQGCVLEPRYGAGRILTFFLFAVLMALYAAYSANIVVLLRAPSSSVRTLPQLLRSPIAAGASDLEYNRYFFKKLNDTIRKDIYNKKIAPKGKKPNFYSMKEGVEMIRQGMFAFHMEVNPGYRLIQDTYLENEKCDLVEIDYINEFDPWLPAPKNSPFKELFKVNFGRYRESGLQQANHRRLNVPKPRCAGTVASFVTVGIIDTYPGLVVMLYGFLLALAILAVEIAVQRIQNGRRHRFAFVN